MDPLDKSRKQINGPFNAIRLEGKVGLIDKVIYLFLDRHDQLHSQKECDNIYAKDIHQYLAESFSDLNDSNRTYDFFLEIHTSELQKMQYGYSNPRPTNPKDIYLMETRKFFNKVFQHNPSENKVFRSEHFKNVRFHYIDIREYFEKYYFFDLGHLIDIMHQMWQYISIYPQEINTSINILFRFKNHCQLILDIMNGKIKRNDIKKLQIIKYVDYDSKEPPKQLTPEEEFENDVEYISYLLDKMFTKYNHKDIQQKLQKQAIILNDGLQSVIKDCNELIDMLNKLNSSIMEVPMHLKHKYNNFDNNFDYKYGPSQEELRDMIHTLYDYTDRLYTKFIFHYMKFMDIYFLRRFLDKDYVTNAIVYTGAWHSYVYIKILIETFGFKITHASFSTITDMEELNKEIPTREITELGEFFLPSIQSQCSDITYFPKKFL